MDKKLLRLVGIFGLSIALLTGCSSSVKEENATLKEEKAKLEETIASQKAEIDQLKKEVESLSQVTEFIPSDGTLVPIFTANIDDFNKELTCFVVLPDKNDLQGSLQAIGDSLSQIYFGGCPIEVVKIDENKIAYIDLKDLNQQISWSKYFQGSAGGAITTKTLVESFLQRDYDGKWISGVKFTYNGKDIEFDHVPELSKISYR